MKMHKKMWLIKEDISLWSHKTLIHIFLISQVFRLKLLVAFFQKKKKTDDGWWRFMIVLAVMSLCICIFTWEISVLMRCSYWWPFPNVIISSKNCLLSSISSRTVGRKWHLIIVFMLPWDADTTELI